MNESSSPPNSSSRYASSPMLPPRIHRHDRAVRLGDDDAGLHRPARAPVRAERVLPGGDALVAAVLLADRLRLLRGLQQLEQVGAGQEQALAAAAAAAGEMALAHVA